MLRRIVATLCVALLLAHPALTRVFADDEPEPPVPTFTPSSAPRTPSPTATAASTPTVSPTATSRATPTASLDATPSSPTALTPTAAVPPATAAPATSTTPSPTAALLSPPATATLEIVTPTPRPTRLAGPPQPTARPIPPGNFYWIGTARVTMYTCFELGGCSYTASGLWPYEGIVAVDPALIPLGATVWVDGLGVFLAADTGALIFGNQVDVYVEDYNRATDWGVQERRVAAYLAP